MSGLERGGDIRFLTLTASPDSPEDIQRSWRALYMRMKRRGLITGYIKVTEHTQAGRLHLHVLFRGSYVAQVRLSGWWNDIHKAPVVDVRSFRPRGGKRRTANYMAKYLSKETAGRYSWSWGWVWRGFCRDWTLYKKYWWLHIHVEGKNEFSNCLAGWKFWLRGLMTVDLDGMRDGFPPFLVFKMVGG